MSKKNQGPLLYIHQPFARTPVTNMQDVFTTKGEFQTIKENKSVPEERKTHQEYIEASDLKVEVEVNEIESKDSSVKQDENHRSGFHRVKPFKEMDLQERLNYLINFPKALPPVSCVFHTSKGDYQGVLKENNDDQIIIQNKDEVVRTISLVELKNITMIGIRTNF